MAKLDDRGREILDDTPVAIPLRFKRPETLTEQIRRIIRDEASRAAAHAGYETFAEADDFEVEDDDYNPRSPHELSIEQELEGYGARDESRVDGVPKPDGQGTAPDEGRLQESGEETEGDGKKAGGNTGKASKS